MNLAFTNLNDESFFESGIRELTAEELDEISGGNPIGAVIGGASSGLGYISSSTVGGNFSYGGLALSVGVGAAIGALGPVSSMVAYVAPRASFYGGYAVGFADNS